MFKKISKIFHKEPIVSVIIPAYNVESYIHQCIDSVLNQTLENIEVILVDDHSTDNTYPILEEYADQDKRIKLLRNDVNKGQSHSRNKALNIAKGKYIYFVDSDDWIELDALKSLVTIADQNELDLLFLKLVTYNEETGEYGKNDYYSYTILKEFENKIFNYQNINPKLLYSIAVSPPSKLYKRSLIEENNIRFIEGLIYEDNVFCNEIFLKAERVSLVDKYLYNRRIRPDSTIHDRGIKNRDIIDVSEALLNVLLKDNNLYYKYNSYLHNFMFSAIRKYHNIIDDKYRMEYFDYYKEFIKRCILEYGVNLDIQQELTSHNLYFYKLGLLSINSDNQKILTLQAENNLDVKVSIIIDCMNHTSSQLSDIIKSIVIQYICFPLIEIILLYEDNYDEIDLLKKYYKTYANIKIFNIDSNTDYLYNTVLPYIQGEYLLFLDDMIDEDYICRLHREISKNNLNVLNGSVLDKKRKDTGEDNALFSVNNKLIKSKSVTDNTFIKEESNQYMISLDYYIKNNISDSDSDIIDYLTKQVSDNSINSYNKMIEILKRLFINKKPSQKNKCFYNIKNFIYSLIVEYDKYDEIMSDIYKNNREFFELIIMSIRTNNHRIKSIQSNITLDTPINIIVYVKDNPVNELNNILNSFIRQSIGFEHLEVTFIDNNSKDKSTQSILREYNNIYYNIKIGYLNKTLSMAQTYNTAIKSVIGSYIILTNKEHVLVNSSIKNIFKAIRKENMNIAIGEVQNNTELPLNSVYTKLFKRDFLIKNNIEIIEEDGKCIINKDINTLKGILNVEIPLIKM